MRGEFGDEEVTEAALRGRAGMKGFLCGVDGEQAGGGCRVMEHQEAWRAGRRPELWSASWCHRLAAWGGKA